MMQSSPLVTIWFVAKGWIFRQLFFSTLASTYFFFLSAQIWHWLVFTLGAPLTMFSELGFGSRSRIYLPIFTGMQMACNYDLFSVEALEKVWFVKIYACEVTHFKSGRVPFVSRIWEKPQVMLMLKKVIKDLGIAFARHGHSQQHIFLKTNGLNYV